VVLLKVFDTSAALFQTGWFLESIATQILVIFLIRSHRPLASANRPPAVLVATSLGAIAFAILIATGPWRASFGFVSIPANLAVALLAITTAYLAAVEVAKRMAFAARRQTQCG
jgi:Mg2+-importing ATPase